jgi:NAD(P)-dependent dehydrogenase (short-subunit alcohol dehydrogenase family)
VVITGSSGIAAAGAHRLARDGARVFVIGREADELDVLSDEVRAHGGDIEVARADLTDEHATVAAFRGCLEAFGRIDGLVAVAGGSGRRFGDGPLDELTLEAWDATFRLNAAPTLLAVREAIRAMRVRTAAGDPSGGAVVVISSVLAWSPSPALFGTAAYAAAKGAQLALVRQLAATYASERIRVNAVAPGLVATPMSVRAQQDERIGRYAQHKQPLAGGFLPADAIADAAAFLVGEDARYVTGQVLAVDGGWDVTEATP